MYIYIYIYVYHPLWVIVPTHCHKTITFGPRPMHVKKGGVGRLPRGCVCACLLERGWIGGSKGAGRCGKDFRRFDKDLQSEIHVFKMKKVPKNCSSCCVPNVYTYVICIYIYCIFPPLQNWILQANFWVSDNQKGRSNELIEKNTTQYTNLLYWEWLATFQKKQTIHKSLSIKKIDHTQIFLIESGASLLTVILNNTQL